MSAVDRRRVPRLGSVEWLALQAGLPQRLWADPALARYARRTKSARRWIVLGTTVAAVTWDVVATLVDGRVIGWPYALIVGWFAARILPELVARNRSVTAVRVAGLSTRSPLRYVTPTAGRWLIASIVLAVTGVVLSQSTGRSLGHDAVPLAASIAVAACGSLAVMRIARRSQPAGNADDLLVDDAIRRVGTTGVIASWSALQYLAAMWLLPVPQTLSDNGTAWLTSMMAYACWIGLAAAWVWVPTRATRPEPSREVAAA